MTLQRLSDDLLEDIMHLVSISEPSYLHHGCLGNDLVSFMRCSRRIYILGEPILYRTLIQTTSKGLPIFTRTILAHPRLVDHVRFVHLTDIDPEIPITINEQVRAISLLHVDLGTSTNCSRNILSSEDLDTIESIILSKTLGSDVARRWIIDIKSGLWEPLAALVLSLLPNIEDLKIENCKSLRWEKLSHIFNLLSHQFSFAVEPGSKLRNLSISYESCSGSRNLTAVPLPLLLPQTLHSFSGDKIRETFWKSPSPEAKVHIKSLRLERSNFSPIAMHQLLNACPEIEYLKYEHENGNDFAFPFNPRQFGDAISHLKETLKELILYRTELKLSFMVAPQQLHTVQSLSGFQRLTSLSITAHLLLGPQKTEGSGWYEAAKRYSAIAPTRLEPLASRLPASLEVLKLRNCGDNIFPDVFGLIEKREVEGPGLKSLVLEFVHMKWDNYLGGFRDRAWRRQMTHDGVDQKEVEKLEILCKEKGVVLDIWYN